MKTHEFMTKDHPEANGRIPQPGEHGYTLKFPLIDGEELQVLCGDETFQHFSQMIGSMMIDDAAEKGAADAR